MAPRLEMASISPDPGEGVNCSSEKEGKEGENAISRGYSHLNRKPNPDDYLPVTGSQNARWWHSTFHNSTAVVGGAVLAFPLGMAYLRWEGGIIALVGFWIVSLYTAWQMVEMHEMVPGKRFNRYHELGQAAFGKKLGLWIIIPQQILVDITLDIAYLLIGGLSLQKFYQLIKCPERSEPLSRPYCHHIGTSAWIIIFTSPHFVLAQLPTFNSLSGLSVAAAVMSVCYTIITWSDLLAGGKVEAPRCRAPGPICESLSHSFYGTPLTTSPNLVFGAMNAIAAIGFGFAGHNVLLEIQATLPSTPNQPSKILMWRGVKWSYVLIALCYFPTAIVGYWAYGKYIVNYDHHSRDILVILNHPRWLIAVANMMVAIHLAGSYQIYAMPVYDLLEITLVRKLHFRRSYVLRIFTRSAYVLLTAFVACTLPFFGDLVALFGGFSIIPSSYFLPCIIWLRLKRPERFGLSWCINWIIIVLGVLLGIVCTTAGLRSIIRDAGNFTFYP